MKSRAVLGVIAGCSLRGVEPSPSLEPFVPPFGISAVVQSARLPRAPRPDQLQGGRIHQVSATQIFLSPLLPAELRVLAVWSGPHMAAGKQQGPLQGTSGSERRTQSGLFVSVSSTPPYLCAAVGSVC